ncbi:MAG: hypothetical protein KGV59_01315 [Tenacibaculum sp.]|nr:hypothetical protein [Tenacibaculum sp.]
MSVSRICPNCYRREGIRVNFGNNHSAEKEFHQQHWCDCGYSSPEEMMKDQDLGFSDAKWVLIIKDFLNTYYNIISTTVIPNKDEHLRLFLKLLKNKINWYDSSAELIPKKRNFNEFEYVRNGKPKKQPKLNIFDDNGLEDVPNQVTITKTNYNLDEVQLLIEYAKAWNNLNVSYLENILSDNFEYNSQWVFDTMYGKETYIDYLKGKFKRIKETNAFPQAEIGYYKNAYGVKNKPCIVIKQNDTKVSIIMKINNGKITNIDMVGFPDPNTAITFDYFPK